MPIKRFTYLYLSLMLFLMGTVTSCQKDAVKEPDTSKASLAADSIGIASHGNFLAAGGMLTVKIKDSTYTFDAAKDSIAFVNVGTADNSRYFGITAINKAHTMSFGISSSGFVNSNVKSEVAGGQFLLNPDALKPALQYTLSKYTGVKDFGQISMVQYNQGNVLAKGTFYTFLAKDDKANSPFYRAEGSFSLLLKQAPPAN